MTKKKSIFLILAGILLLGGFFSAGCGTFNWFNPDFLNQYQPLGITSLNTLQAKGPVTLVLENLTIEAKHQEKAMFTVYYVDAQGNTQTLTPRTPLNAVPEADRSPSSATFDSSYRQVYVLDCGVREIWFSATVYRTKIVSTTTTIDLGNQTSEEITYCAAMITRTPSDTKLPATSMTTNEFATFTAYQAPPYHLKVTKHFECGDVIAAGILDARTAANTVIPMVLECDYTDLNSLPQVLTGDPALYPPGAPLYIFNPTHSLLLQEYQYPASYVIVPLALPNMSGVDNALAAMQLVASEWAGKDLTNTTSKTKN